DPALPLTHLQAEAYHVALLQALQFCSRADVEGHRHRVHVVRDGLMLDNDDVGVGSKLTNDSSCLEGAERGIRAGSPRKGITRSLLARAQQDSNPRDGAQDLPPGPLLDTAAGPERGHSCP